MCAHVCVCVCVRVFRCFDPDRGACVTSSRCLQYIESPDVEKEVKRLLSTDAEAVSVRILFIREGFLSGGVTYPRKQDLVIKSSKAKGVDLNCQCMFLAV